MIINALKLENSDAVSQIENSYKARIHEVKAEKSSLLESIREINGQLTAVENEKHTEMLKREELEEELAWRGKGHESEVEINELLTPSRLVCKLICLVFSLLHGLLVLLFEKLRCNSYSCFLKNSAHS